MATEVNNPGEFPPHILQAAEEWTVLHEAARQVSDKEIQKDVGALALRQFRNLHKFMNGHLSYLDEAMTHTLIAHEDPFVGDNVERVYGMALERRNLVNFAIDFPPVQGRETTQWEI